MYELLVHSWTYNSEVDCNKWLKHDSALKQFVSLSLSPQALNHAVQDKPLLILIKHDKLLYYIHLSRS